MTTADTLRLELPELTIEALTWGYENNPLALCLHGFPDTAWTWRHLGPLLAERGWFVVAPFARGYAPTSIPVDGDYHIAALMHDAIELYNHLGADASAVLIGHDWGAATANALAAYPQTPFSKIVSMAVPPLSAFWPQRVTDIVKLPLLLGRQAAMSWYMGFNQLPFAPELLSDKLVESLWERWSPGYDAREDLELLASSLPDNAHKRAAYGYYRALLRPRISGKYTGLQRYFITRPRMPLLYLHGDQDGCMTADLADRTIETLPEGSEVHRIADAGHFLHLERPDLVNGLIADYFDDI